MAALDIVTEIDIAATPAKLWEVLTRFREYPEWNPFILSIEGVPAAGERLEVRIRPKGGKPMVFRPRVLVARPGSELRWLGRVLLPGLFDGEHYFRIAERPGGVRFTHGEVFSGFLLPLFRGSLMKATRDGIVGMNAALKVRAEA